MGNELPTLQELEEQDRAAMGGDLNATQKLGSEAAAILNSDAGRQLISQINNDNDARHLGLAPIYIVGDSLVLTAKDGTVEHFMGNKAKDEMPTGAFEQHSMGPLPPSSITPASSPATSKGPRG
jgi:hypothetical protein